MASLESGPASERALLQGPAHAARRYESVCGNTPLHSCARATPTQSTLARGGVFPQVNSRSRSPLRKIFNSQRPSNLCYILAVATLLALRARPEEADDSGDTAFTMADEALKFVGRRDTRPATLTITVADGQEVLRGDVRKADVRSCMDLLGDDSDSSG